jgi:crotonobetainyl-CoA:carnitine CoA-transferase CaiB-like acyl-CoA transferase
MTTAQTLSTPLAGIKVIDLTSVLYGPYATQMLADLGADVIKIESPEGDPTRNLGPRRHEKMAAGFLGVNRNKKSVVLDLKKKTASEALWRLIDTADVFVHNIRPQKIEKLGFSSHHVMARNDKLVYGAFHGYLEAGPYGGRPAYDDIIQGQSGIAAAFLARDGKPAYAPSVIADKSSGLIAATALTAALFQRLRQDRGVYVEIGMFESMVAYALLEHQFGATFSPPLGEAGYSRVISAERKPFATKDGYICMLPYTDKQWAAFWQLAAAPEYARDSRFSTIRIRTENIDALYEIAGDLVKTNTSAYWLERLSAAEIPSGPINTFADLDEDPHLNALNFFREYKHPSEGELKVMDVGVKFDKQSLPIRHHQPRLGEHSEEILGELGFSTLEVNELLSDIE